MTKNSEKKGVTCFLNFLEKELLESASNRDNWGRRQGVHFAVALPKIRNLLAVYKMQFIP